LDDVVPRDRGRGATASKPRRSNALDEVHAARSLGDAGGPDSLRDATIPDGDRQKNDGTAGLVLAGAGGAHRAEVKLDANGTVDISLFDDAGKPTFEVSVSPDGRIRQSSAQP
jgi:hypothetical protein